MTTDEHPTETDQFRQAITNLAAEWQNEHDRAIRAGFKTYLAPSAAAAALRNILADTKES